MDYRTHTLSPRDRKLSVQEDVITLGGFDAIRPRYVSAQNDLLTWLTEAHAHRGGPARETMAALFSRYSAGPDHIATRAHELSDFTHTDWERMRLFGSQGSDISAKTTFFDERVSAIFERFYPEGSSAPESLVHVTCTGYTSPSGAQRLVAKRGWGSCTQVLHAYHMGCYASHPALRMAAGLALAENDPARFVDVVHTELCSLHLDPGRHDPAQLVIQSLFSDGFIRYRVGRAIHEGGDSFELLALQDEIIPDSEKAMRWTTGPLTFAMELSREVPTLLASVLPRFAERLFAKAGLELAKERERAIFAIHPGGPRIIELSQKVLNLDARQVAWSRAVLMECGNMSSATLPHIWKKILDDHTIPEGTLVASFGAGPGLTLSGALFKKV